MDALPRPSCEEQLACQSLAQELSQEPLLVTSEEKPGYTALVDSGVLALDRSMLDSLRFVVYWPHELYAPPFTTPLERPPGGAAGMLMHSLLALDAAQDELRACRTGRRSSDGPPQGQGAAVAIRALSAEVAAIQEAADRWTDMAEKMVERLTTSRHPAT